MDSGFRIRVRYGDFSKRMPFGTPGIYRDYERIIRVLIKQYVGVRCFEDM